MQTRIYLLSTIGNDTRLLENWLRYYSEFGFDGIFLSLQIRDKRDNELATTVESLAKSYGSVVADYHRSPEYRQAERIQRLKEACCGPDDWVALADLDEFAEYSSPPHSLVETCRDEGYDYVKGYFLDRIGMNGTLPSLDEISQLPIWDLLPLGCHISRDVSLATDHKVVLASSRSKIGYGQHSATGLELPVERGTALVHHFKWDAAAIERTRYMLWLYAMQGEPWVLERLRTLRFWESNDGSGGDSESTTALPVYWPRYRRSIQVGTSTGKPFNDGIDLPYTVLRRQGEPAHALINAIQGHLGDVDAASIIRSIHDNLDGVKTVGEVTDILYRTLRPDGRQYLALESHVQHVVHHLLVNGYAEFAE